MGKSGPPTIGYRYFMGLHLGISHGPVNSILQIRAGDRQAWSGNATTNTQIFINAPNLFGGDTKEGGLVGYLDIMMGAANQQPNDYLQFAQGVQQPAYRGICTVVYRQGEVCALNPYLKPWQFQVWRSTAGWTTPTWYPETANVVLMVEADVYDDSNYTTNKTGVSDNPNNINFNPNNPTSSKFNYAQASAVNCQNGAHIIYECLTNGTWGLGYPIADVDDASFRKAALQLYNEGFGLCITWTQQDQIDKFVQSICDHIGACFVVNPQTGLYQLKLIRSDYVTANLLVLDTTNVKSLDFTRATPLNMVNEVQVSYVNANSGKNHKTPPAQNSANIANAGGIISQAKDYPGIPCGALALRVAMRDLATQGTPLSQLKLKVSRSAAVTLTPGDVFLLNWTPLALVGIVYRVGEMNYGKLDDGTITITAVEDVFGLPDSSYAQVQQSQWLAYDPTPQPVSQRLLQEVSYRDIAKALGSTAIQQLPGGTTFGTVFARKPGAISINYNLWTTIAGGNLELADAGANFTPYGQLSVAIPPAYTSVLALTSTVDVNFVALGTACQIGTERCIVTNVVKVNALTTNVTVARGTDDTVPHDWPVGTNVWFYENFEGIDQNEYTANETWYARELTRTSQAVLAMAAAPQDALVFQGRPYQPLAPGQLTLNGQAYPSAFSGDMTIAWAARNRLTQLDTLVPTGAGGITAEAGVSYNLGLYAETGGLIRTVNVTTLNYDYTQAQQQIDQSNVSVVPMWSREFLTSNLNDLKVFSDPASAYPVVRKAGNVLQLGGSDQVDTLVQLIAAPQLADFEIECDLLMHNLTQAGFVFRNTQWSTGRAQWAYAGYVAGSAYGTSYLLYGPNAKSGGAGILGIGSYSAANDVWTKLRIRAVGTTISVWANDVLQVTVSDSHHTNAGGFGLYTANNSGLGGYVLFRNIRLRKVSPRPLGSFKFTLAAARAGVASYDSHNVTVYGHGWGLAWGTSWGN